MTKTLDRPGDYIQGRFVSPAQADEEIRTLSPADQSDVVGIHSVSVTHVDDAVAAARKALPAWRRLSREERRGYLRKYQERVRHHRGPARGGA